MDILEESFGAVTSPVSLEQLVATDLPTMTLPKSAARNRAATTALLASDPEKAVSDYQLMMREVEVGQASTQKQLTEAVTQNTNKTDMHGVMSVLGDPKVSFEEKQRIVRGVKDSNFLADSGTRLHTSALSAGSKGENAENESARLSAADSIREVYDARRKIQGLVNAHAASLPNASAGTVADMAALWVMPFGNSISTGKIKKSLNPNQSIWQTVKGFIASGTTVEEIRDKLANLPPKERVEFTKSIRSSVEKDSGIIFGSDNQFAQWDKMNSIFEDGGYGSFDKWMDNISPLLDIFGLGQIARGGSKAAKAASAGTSTPPVDKVIKAEWELVDEVVPKNPFAARIGTPPKQLEMADQIKRIEANSIIRKENPASPANIVQSANPEKARSIHDLVMKSSTDEVAEAMYGTSKSQAVINDVFPQVVTESGAVSAKVPDIGRNLRKEMQVSDEVVDLIHDTGGTYYTAAEKAAVRASRVNDFKAAEGFTAHDSESAFSISGGRIRIDGMYGTAEGGFLRAEDALTQVRFAMKNTGIPESDMTLMKRSGLDYVPTTLAESAGKDGSYKVRISSYSEISPSDFYNVDKGGSALEPMIIKRNWLDSIPGLTSNSTGSAARYVMDASSMLPKNITGPAAVATDATSRFEKVMLSVASEFSDPYVKLPKARQAALMDYFKEANYNGIAFDRTALRARQFSPEEVNVIHNWKTFWDGHFYLENYDLVRTLDAQGYRMFKNPNIELYVKPIPKNQNIGRFYDPATDSIIPHSKAQGDALYQAGGTYAKLRRPAEINGRLIEYMIVRNTPTEYTRKFNNSDNVLNYRDGYFQIQYAKNAKFVDEIDGDVVRTIAVAGDTLEATAFATRMTASGNGRTYRVRGDVRGLRRDGDEWWDINSASGRIAQRQRGKLLEDASGLNHLGDGSYIVNPVDSAVRAAKSISGRTVNRPMLEAAKARFIQQFGHLLGSNGAGGKAWPSRIEAITSKGEATTKELRDARTAYEYINYLENGYINTMDDVIKAGFNWLAGILGKYSVAAGSTKLAKMERGALAASEVAVSTSVKSGVYLTYIVSNVFRQWVVQPHQALRMAAYNPKGMANGGILKLAAGYLGGELKLPGFTNFIGKGFELIGDITHIKTPHLVHDDFAEFVKASGLFDSVDKSNLVRGTLLEAADSTNVVGRFIGKYATIPARKIGFDLGETINLLLHAAAVYERRMRGGGDLKDLAQRDEAYSEIRAVSGDMNFAGDFPYNQTSPSVLMQFMQVGHKMLLQATNRRIDIKDRMRMVAVDMVLWGSPAVAVASWLGKDILPEDPIAKEAVAWGLESALLNNFLSQISGRPVSLDFSSLAPYDPSLSGWKEFFTHLLTGGPAAVIANSPSGQLFLKEGGRVRTAIASVSRLFGFSEDMDETPESAVRVAKEVAKVLSGVHNITKAQIILDTGKTWDRTGKLTDEGLGVTEAVAQVFGFTTSTSRDMFKSIKENSADVKAHKERVTQDIKAIMAYYTTALATDNADLQWITKVTGKVLRTYQNDPVAQDIMNAEIEKALRSKDQILIDSILKVVDIPGIGNTRDRISRLPISDEQKKMLLQITVDVENAREKYDVKE